MKSIIYNGSHVCEGCAGPIGPVESMVDKKLCANCRREQHNDHVKRRMA